MYRIVAKDQCCGMQVRDLAPCGLHPLFKCVYFVLWGMLWASCVWVRLPEEHVVQEAFGHFVLRFFYLLGGWRLLGLLLVVFDSLLNQVLFRKRCVA